MERGIYLKSFKLSLSFSDLLSGLIKQCGLLGLVSSPFFPPTMALTSPKTDLVFRRFWMLAGACGYDAGRFAPPSRLDVGLILPLIDPIRLGVALRDQ